MAEKRKERWWEKAPRLVPDARERIEQERLDAEALRAEEELIRQAQERGEDKPDPFTPDPFTLEARKQLAEQDRFVDIQLGRKNAVLAKEPEEAETGKEPEHNPAAETAPEPDEPEAETEAAANPNDPKHKPRMTDKEKAEACSAVREVRENGWDFYQQHPFAQHMGLDPMTLHALLQEQELEWQERIMQERNHPHPGRDEPDIEPGF